MPWTKEEDILRHFFGDNIIQNFAETLTIIPPPTKQNLLLGTQLSSHRVCKQP